jgi:NAD(P)-dependent dehydrogenase (short-subunit alcohol dehydrogenase family)
MDFDLGLRDVHVLITGAAGGIGLELTRTFVRIGARVTAQYHTNRGQLDDISGIVAVQADVHDEASVNNLLMRAAEQNNGPVSVLIVNHGIWPPNDTLIMDMELSQWEKTISVNLTGAFLLCRAYLRTLRPASETVKSTASIIFLGSTAGKYGEANHGDYAASKSALMYGLTRTLKNEIVIIAPKGRVNSVSPGWVATPMATETLKDELFLERALATTPLQKFAQPKDIAFQIVNLASPVLSGHVTGINLMVHGGMEGRLLFPPKH